MQYSSILAVQKYNALEFITFISCKMQWKYGLSHQMIDKDDNWSKSHKDHDFYNIKGVTIYKLQWWGEGARNSPLFKCWTSTCNCRCQLKDAMIVPMVMWHPADREDIGEANLRIRCQVLTSPQKEVSRVARECHTKIGRQITMATRRNGWRWPCEWRLVWHTQIRDIRGAIRWPSSLVFATRKNLHRRHHHIKLHYHDHHHGSPR